jgi:hypothetical protein
VALDAVVAPRARAMPSVLFVCTGKSSRSPIAEALLRRRASAGVHVGSAGIRPQDRVHPSAVRVLRERYDLDIARQRPRPLDVATRRRLGRVITLCDKAREPCLMPRTRCGCTGVFPTRPRAGGAGQLPGLRGGSGRNRHPCCTSCPP